MSREQSEDEKILDALFEWPASNDVIATVTKEEAVKASYAWLRYKLAYKSTIENWRRIAESQKDNAVFHRCKADYWLTALQNERIKNAGDYTHRYFIRRPRMRRLIQFLMKL
jgi:hypothetical protein